MNRFNVALDDLQAFVAVADCAGFRPAAERLCVSQPALSRRVHKLETALGLRLLERSTRRVAVTAAGQQFLPQARQMLDDLQAALSQLAGSATTRRSLVTVACVPSVAQHLLPPVLKAFVDTHPGVRLRLIDESAHRVLSSVTAGESDLGLSFTGAQETGVLFTPLLREDYVLAVPAGHRLARRRSVAWVELADEPMVAVSQQSGNRLLIDQALAALPRRPVALHETAHVTGALALVAAGLGLAAVPRLSLPPGGPLRIVPLEAPTVSRVLGLMQRADRPLSAMAQALADALRAALVPKGPGELAMDGSDLTR